MREIKFRGMDIKGTWHYGLVGNTVSGWFISNRHGDPLAYTVRPETITEFAGLKDKNGIEIYENDILKDKKGTGIVGFIAPSFLVQVGEGKYFKLAGGDYLFEDIVLKHTEVIGNIYENPRLLDILKKETKQEE